MTGWISVKNRRVQFESALERDLYILLDFNPGVVGVVEQPLKIHFFDSAHHSHSYTPDVLVEYRHRAPELCEVKYRADIKKDWPALKPKFRAGRLYARQCGLKFRIMTEVEIRRPALRNITFLRSYQESACDPYVREHLLKVIGCLGTTSPEALLESAFWTCSDQSQAVAVIWRLIAENVIYADLSCPLTMASSIRLTRREEFLWLRPHLSHLP